MKRFSFRSSALLVLPCLIFPLGALVASRVPKAASSIEVQKSERRPPTPNAFHDGADVGAIVKLNELPDDNASITWANFYRVDAGGHALWNSKDGDGERKTAKITRHFNGAWNQWEGNFDLDTVPPEWGDVVLTWQSRLTHGRTLSLMGKRFDLSPINASRSGQIILRRANEKLDYSAQIDRKPHLKLVDCEVSRLKKSSSGVSYRVRLICQRDWAKKEFALAEFQSSIELKGYRNYPSQETRIHGIYGGLEDTYIFDSSQAEKNNRISTFTQDYGDISSYGMLKTQGSLHVEAKFSYQDHWPLTVSVPVTNSNGHVLLRKSRVKVPGQFMG